MRVLLHIRTHMVKACVSCDVVSLHPGTRKDMVLHLTHDLTVYINMQQNSQASPVSLPCPCVHMGATRCSRSDPLLISSINKSCMPAQEFINNLLDECAKCGITDISESVPETVWHQGGNMTVEDTLREAVNIGQKMFNMKPSLILILLPGNGVQLLNSDCSFACSCSMS